MLLSQIAREIRNVPCISLVERTIRRKISRSSKILKRKGALSFISRKEDSASIS